MRLSDLLLEYRKLRLEDVIDHERFSLISIDHHSTRIEGSTLTEVETQVLLTEGKTPKGKPLEDSLMVTDHHSALLFVIQCAGKKLPVSQDLIQEINSLVMRNTGKVYNTMLGAVESSKGAFRKGNVVAGSSYFPNYDKVERLTSELATFLNESLGKLSSDEDKVNLAFDAHFNLVSVHPFYDGNGRISRLLMNYILAYYDLPLAIVYSESKSEYIQALVDAREKQDIQIFRDFMYGEYEYLLKSEIEKYKEMQKPSKGNGFSFLF